MVDLDNLKKLDYIYDELLRTIPGATRENMMIGGGAVRDLLGGYEPKDIDIFLTGGDKRGRFATLMKDSVSQFTLQIREAIRENYLDTHRLYSVVRDDMVAMYADRDAVFVVAEIYDYDKSSRNAAIVRGDIGLNDPYDTTLDRGGVKFGYPVQVIIYTHCTDLKEILDDFDLDICMYGYNGELIQGSKAPTLEDFPKKLDGTYPIELFKTQNRTRTYSRLKKFHEKYGVDTTMAKEKLHTMKIDTTSMLFAYEPKPKTYSDAEVAELLEESDEMDHKVEEKSEPWWRELGSSTIMTDI